MGESGSKKRVRGNRLRAMDAACTGCGEEVEARFRFCPWCGAAQRRKLVEFFWPHPNSPGRALRVSRYFGDEEARRLAEFVCRTAPVSDTAETL